MSNIITLSGVLLIVVMLNVILLTVVILSAAGAWRLISLMTLECLIGPSN